MAALTDEINAHTAHNGYVIAKNGGRNGQLVYRYAKGRQTKNHARPDVHESKRRKTSPQMPACPFRLPVQEWDNWKALLRWS